MAVDKTHIVSEDTDAAQFLDSLVQDFQIHASWLPALRPVAPQLAAILEKLAQLDASPNTAPSAEQGASPSTSQNTAVPAAEKVAYLPARENIFAALQQPFEQVKVLILGQDPYPTPGDAMGLSFSVRPGQAIPRSLRNIYAELEADLGIAPVNHGDLRAWSKQGVCLLNRVLTVAPGQAGSHSKLGWQEITDALIAALAARDTPLVAVLWGKQAQSAKPLLVDAQCIESAHPSPLSARRGFFGSRPFSRINELLQAQGATAIDWQLPAVVEMTDSPSSPAQPLLGQQRLL